MIAVRQILLVEDEELPRESLARLLQRRGYEVVLAESASGAIRQADQSDVGVILMDVVLGGDEMDGVDAAQEIQRSHPFCSFIFVTAFAADPGYRQRVSASNVHVGGWIEKPIHLDDLEQLIIKESQKVSVRRKLLEGRSQGAESMDALEVLAEQDPSLSPQILRELREELGKNR